MNMGVWVRILMQTLALLRSYVDPEGDESARVATRDQPNRASFIVLSNPLFRKPKHLLIHSNLSKLHQSTCPVISGPRELFNNKVAPRTFPRKITSVGGPGREGGDKKGAGIN
jgi:hypothetical protein